MQKDFELHGVPIRFVIRKSRPRVAAGPGVEGGRRGGKVARPTVGTAEVKKKRRNTASSRPVGTKRKTNMYALVRRTRAKRIARRKRDKKVRK